LKESLGALFCLDFLLTFLSRKKLSKKYFKKSRIGEVRSFELGTGKVIKGWDEGIALMKVGDKFRLLIPYQLAYGEQGYPGAIPPKSNLIFDVDLLDVK